MIFIIFCIFAGYLTESNAFVALQDLAVDLAQDPPADADLDDESAMAYCREIYENVNPEKVEGFFYGGLEETARFLKELSVFLHEYGYVTDYGLEIAALENAGVWEFVHFDLSAEEKTRDTITETMKEGITDCPEELLGYATDFSFFCIQKYEPDIITDPILMYE